MLLPSASLHSASSNRDFHGLRRAVSFKWMDATRDVHLWCATDWSYPIKCLTLSCHELTGRAGHSAILMHIVISVPLTERRTRRSASPLVRSSRQELRMISCCGASETRKLLPKTIVIIAIGKAASNLLICQLRSYVRIVNNKHESGNVIFIGISGKEAIRQPRRLEMRRRTCKRKWRNVPEN